MPHLFLEGFHPVWAPFAERAIFFPCPTPFCLREENPTETISHRTEGVRGVCGPPERTPTPGLPERLALCPAGLHGAHTRAPMQGGERVCNLMLPSRSAPLPPPVGAGSGSEGSSAMPRQQNCFPVGLVGPGASSRVRNVWFPPALGTVRT